MNFIFQLDNTQIIIYILRLIASIGNIVTIIMICDITQRVTNCIPIKLRSVNVCELVVGNIINLITILTVPIKTKLLT